MSFHNALIRTHHMTSRKKVAKLRTAAHLHSVYALLRSGGAPGIMYCEGTEIGVKDWVNTVNRLRYKDYQLVTKPSPLVFEKGEMGKRELRWGVLEEEESVKGFGARMEELGVREWWRRGMGYVSE